MSEVDDFWARCRRDLPAEGLGDRFVVRRMGNSAELSGMLLGLVTSGQKTGLFSRLEELAAAGLTPNRGDFVVFADYAGRPRCLVRMEECRLLKFSEIGPEHTASESPAARDLDVWRDIHRRYWTLVLAAEGVEFTEDILVLFQKFRLLHSENPAPAAD